MARDNQSSPANEKKLEQYGVWVKVKPREVVPAAAAEDIGELTDLETPRSGAAAAQGALTAEEEKLLDELETEIGPDESRNDVLVPDEEPLLDDEGELPDIENMTEDAADGLAEEELPELEEEPLTAPQAAPHRKPASSEVEVTLRENGGGKERFDDLEALESELASVTTTARSGSSSSDILARIEEELRSIRTDLTQLRGELTGLRKGAAAPAAATPATGAETQSGFFDEDEDETIALTGDELDNILNTADIMEETAEAPNAGGQEIPNEAEIAPPLDDILSFDTPELEQEKGAPAAEDDTLVLSEDSLLPEGDAALEELPAEMVLEELDEPSASKGGTGVPDLEELPELDLEGIPEIETEALEAPAGKKPEKPGAQDDAGDETIDLETLDLGEEPNVIEAVPAQLDDSEGLADDVDLEALAAEAEELAGNAPATETEDLEIGELESIGDEPAAEKAQEIEIDFESDKEPAAAEVEELEPATDLGSAEEILEAEEVGGEAPAARGQSGVPDDLKDEIRTVLKYMDHLLEALPDEKIQEFASSDYFVMYKKLFEDLGLGE
jgi:pilus assembly protein FimV